MSDQNTQVGHTRKQLPSLVELTDSLEVAFKNDELNKLLNQPPHQQWIKQHPYITVKHEIDGKEFKLPYNYIPIDKIEFMLTRIFQRWEVKVNSFTTLFNAVAVHVTLRVKNPLDGSWIEQDGLGAVDVQTEKGASAADLSKINASAVMKALPAAESYAIKDAAEKLGDLFGKSLNKRDIMAFSGNYSDNEELRKQMAQKQMNDLGERFKEQAQ